MAEQDRVIGEIQRSNDKAHVVYRACLLVVYALVAILYLTPVPDYVTGKHPKSHLTLFLHTHNVIGTTDDLTYLPAFPIYVVTALACFAIMWLAACEVADVLRLVQRKPMAFPSQPHPYGTAPNFLVPVLRDLRLQRGSGLKIRQASEPTKVPITSVLPPRLAYLCFLWVCTWPIPLITFGVGAFDDAAWWMMPFAAVSLHLLIEYWIFKAESETIGLTGMKYAYKGA